MTSKSHKKHALLTKPKGGAFGQQELALIGAPCNLIQNLSEQLDTSLKTEYGLGYADSSHQNDMADLALRQIYPTQIR